jgi:hypothetical protein
MTLRECLRKTNDKVYLSGYQITLKKSDIEKAGLKAGDLLKVDVLKEALIIQKVRAEK